jgi:hypothetical protein
VQRLRNKQIGVDCLVCHVKVYMRIDGEFSTIEDYEKAMHRSGGSWNDHINEAPDDGAFISQLSSLCKRHFLLWSLCSDRGLPLGHFPSHLVRTWLWLNQFDEDIIRQNVAYYQAQANAPVVRTSTKPAVFGPYLGTFQTAGESGTSMTNFGIYGMGPATRQVVDQKAQERQREALQALGALSVEGRNKQEAVRQASSILQTQLSSFPPAFKTCLNCHQSELSLDTPNCPWCGGSGFDVEVDPTGIVPRYADLVSPQSV